MSKFIVVLTNTSHGITVGTVAVCGNSGKRYGHSQYSDKYRCHAIHMTLEEYRIAKDDLARGWHKALCKWVPDFIKVEETEVNAVNNPVLRDTAINWARQLSVADITAIAREHGLIITAVPIEKEADQIQENRMDALIASVGAAAEPSSTPFSDGLEGSQLPTKYLSLCKLARDEGVDISALPRTGEAVRAAILSHRQQKAA